jgi:hypothetical protein
MTMEVRLVKVTVLLDVVLRPPIAITTPGGVRPEREIDWFVLPFPPAFQPFLVLVPTSLNTPAHSAIPLKDFPADICACMDLYVLLAVAYMIPLTVPPCSLMAVVAVRFVWTPAAF